jgi:hypothetical protein
MVFMVILENKILGVLDTSYTDGTISATDLLSFR